MNKSLVWLIAVLVVVAVVVVVIGYYMKNQYYETAQKQMEEIAFLNALTQGSVPAEDLVPEENPFEVENPLEGAELNPFEGAKEALNPFKLQ